MTILPESTNSPAASLTSEPEKLLPVIRETGALCEACGKPVEVGQVALCYDDAGEMHADCERPFALDYTRKNGEPMPVVLLGSPMSHVALSRLSSPVSGTDMVELVDRLTDLADTAKRAVADSQGLADHKLLILANYGDLALQMAPAFREALSASPTPPIPMIAEAGEREAEIDRLAQFLHDEGNFSDAMPDRTWPEHPGDTGQRENGWVKIVPSDVRAHFRDVARRWLLPCDATPATAVEGQSCKTCKGRRKVVVLEGTCEPQHEAPCPECVGRTIATASVSATKGDR